MMDEKMFAENMRHYFQNGYLSAWQEQARITCADCGSLVWDKFAHDQFHGKIEGLNNGA